MKFYNHKFEHIKTIPKKFEVLLKEDVLSCFEDLSKKRLTKTERAKLELLLFKTELPKNTKELVYKLELTGRLIIRNKFSSDTPCLQFGNYKVRCTNKVFECVKHITDTLPDFYKNNSYDSVSQQKTVNQKQMSIF